jgi:histidyl-tRNA synthetase
MKSDIIVAGVLLLALLTFPQASGQVANKVIPPNAKVFVAPMPDGFDEYLKAAIEKKKVPIEIVTDKDKADFQIIGQAETQKASTAKKVILWDWRSNEQASIQITNLTTSEVVFAYSVNKVSSAHGKKSSAEACAKHLKEKIDSKQ